MEDFIAVNPLLTDEGALASLVPILGAERSIPLPLESTDSTNLFKNFRVVQDDMSIESAARLGLSGIFGGSIESGSRALLYDAIAYTDKVNFSPENPISATRWGIGLRIAVKIWNIKTDFELNLGTISGAVEAGMAKARYEISGPGLGIDGLQIVLDAIPQIAEFNYETYYKLSTTVVKNISKYISDNKNTLEPMPLAVVINAPIEADIISQSKAVVFAMKGIASKTSLRECIDQSRGMFSTAAIRKVYSSIVGTIPEGDKPSSSAERRAEEWIESTGLHLSSGGIFY